jgi:D-alanyl-D-alanine-carboxypeptidase/D-alanyl-D-alanine-endopeptidase
MSKIVPPTMKYLDSLVDPYLANQPSGLAFVIGYVGPSFQHIYFKGNLANQFRKELPLDQNTYFELASVSKTFTATLAAAVGSKYHPNWETQYVQNYTVGAVSGGLRIGSQFGPMPLPSLLSYTSGLPADNGAADDLPIPLPIPYSPAGMLGYLNMTSLTPTDIGTRYRYSNLGFSIMAQILPLFQTIPSLPDFTSLMSEMVLDPLNLRDTYFFQDIPLDKLALGYTYENSQTNPTPVPPGWPNFDAYYGAGGVVSTPRDMMTWLRFNMGLIDDRKDSNLADLLPQLQSPATATKTPWGDQLGLSWFLTSPVYFGPSGAVWKDGEISGTNTYITFLPWVDTFRPSEAGVFVLTNCDSLLLNGTEIVAAIANDVLLVMQGVTPPADKSNYPRVFGR